MRLPFVASLILIVGCGSNCLAQSEPQSSHLRGFRLQDCNKDGACYRATGELAYISSSGGALSATGVKLEIQRTRAAKPEHLTCAEFRFDLATNYLICNNSDIKNAKSVLIDRDHRIDEIPATN